MIITNITISVSYKLTIQWLELSLAPIWPVCEEMRHDRRRFRRCVKKSPKIKKKKRKMSTQKYGWG